MCGMQSSWTRTSDLHIITCIIVIIVQIDSTPLESQATAVSNRHDGRESGKYVKNHNLNSSSFRCLSDWRTGVLALLVSCKAVLFALICPLENYENPLWHWLTEKNIAERDSLRQQRGTNWQPNQENEQWMNEYFSIYINWFFCVIICMLWAHLLFRKMDLLHMTAHIDITAQRRPFRQRHQRIPVNCVQ